MKIYPYSDNQRYRICVHGDNVSSVIDRMIRVAAKTTENYASDVIFWCNRLTKAIENQENIDCVLNFREDGVDLYEQAQMENPGTLRSVLSGGIQQWLLTVVWENNIPVTEFLRVRICG